MPRLVVVIGATGVGKTETAKLIAKKYFGDESRLIKIDMSMFMEAHSVSKLIGAPPGYIGFDNFGDEAIASVLIANLKKNGAEKITVLSSNPIKTANLYGVNSEYFLKFFKPILETDVLISGGGSLLQDVTSLKINITQEAILKGE